MQVFAKEHKINQNTQIYIFIFTLDTPSEEYQSRKMIRCL